MKDDIGQVSKICGVLRGGVLRRPFGAGTCDWSLMAVGPAHWHTGLSSCAWWSGVAVPRGCILVAHYIVGSRPWRHDGANGDHTWKCWGMAAVVVGARCVGQSWLGRATALRGVVEQLAVVVVVVTAAYDQSDGGAQPVCKMAPKASSQTESEGVACSCEVEGGD